MIAIIDYGMGNLHSVSKAIERLDSEYVITEDPQQIKDADQIILPGVGAFADAMKQLRGLKLDKTIAEVVADGTPLLGICLGMQLLFTSSEEGGVHQGLNLLPGHVRRLPGKTATGETYKVPQMGWNELHLQQPHHPLVANIDRGYTYFVHSYYVAEMDSANLIADTDYHEQVPGIVGRDHIMGMQFHPEKSGSTGMQLLQNFCQLVKENG